MAASCVQVRYDPAFRIAVVWCRTCGTVAARSTVGVDATMQTFLSRHDPDPCRPKPQRRGLRVLPGG